MKRFFCKDSSTKIQILQSCVGKHEFFCMTFMVQYEVLKNVHKMLGQNCYLYVSSHGMKGRLKKNLLHRYFLLSSRLRSSRQPGVKCGLNALFKGLNSARERFLPTAIGIINL